MVLVFWLVAGLVIYAYVGYPLLILLASFLRRPLAAGLAVDLPRVTLLLVVHNEDASVEAKIENTLALDYPKDLLEILVVSDGSTDSTESIIRRFEDRGVSLVRLSGP